LNDEKILKMDYKAMWKRMRNEMKYLQDKDVGVLAPAVALGFMDFIEEIERQKEPVTSLVDKFNLPTGEQRYYFTAGDKVMIPEACFVAFFSPDGKVIHPTFNAKVEIDLEETALASEEEGA